MADIVRVFEHQKLKADNNEVLTEQHLIALAKYQERTQSPYFRMGYKSVTFTEYVGAIRVGNLTIEVLPKQDKPTGLETKEEKKLWQKTLVKILRKVYGLEIHATSQANLSIHANSVFDLYFEIFIAENEYLIQTGLIKKYRKEEGNQNALKGSLLFGRHIQKNLTHQERFYVRYTAYDRNNPYNRVLYKTLKVLQYLNISPSLKSRVEGLILKFPELPDISVSETFFENLPINRKTENYQKALQISKLILLNYHPDLSKGTNDVLALMFDMNDLWERYVLASLRSVASSNKIKVNTQETKYFWQSNTGNRKKIRPDIILSNENGQRIVIDTKWKIREMGNPDDADLKQMFVYNQFWGANKSYLLYPGKENAHLGGNFYELNPNSALSPKNQAHQIWVSVVNEENMLDKDLGKKILQLIEKDMQYQEQD